MRNQRNRAPLAALGVLLACSSSPAGPPNGLAVIDVSPNPLIVHVGQTGSLQATAYDSLGLAAAGVAIQWSSAASNIARIDGSGTVTGVAVGTTTVTARNGSVRGTAVVNVIDPGAITLEVSPATASTQVGGSVPFTVIARDGNGVIVAAPGVTWNSSAPAVASIDNNGVALGLTPGMTSIGAVSGTLVARPAQLQVLPASASLCDNIAQIETFDARLGWAWARAGVNDQNHRIEIDQSAELVFTLRRLGPPLTSAAIQTWEGRPGGNGAINDSDTNLASLSVYTLRGQGAVLPSANGVTLPDFVLEVDLETCRYRFQAAPWITATVTDPNGDTTSGPFTIGVIMSEWIDLENWRTTGLVGFDERFPAHSFQWLGGKSVVRAYIPAGYGQQLFIGKAGTNEAAEGEATVSWAITR